MNYPMISVIMPVYNGEKYLREALDSILNQTYKDFELILIDDGSKDKTLEIMQKYKQEDNRIVLISRENKGLIASLNEGISKARGQFMARMDGDDINDLRRFQKQLDLMESKNADLCGCHYHWINESGDFTRCTIVPLHYESFLTCMAITVPFAHPSVMIRKQFLIDRQLSYGKPTYTNIEDYALWVDCWNHGAKIVNVNEFLFCYRSYSSSLSNRNNQKILIERKKLQTEYLLKYKKQIIKSFENFDFSKAPEEELIRLVVIMLILLFKYFDISIFKYLKKIKTKSLVIGTFIFLSNRY